jgi:hypothetical protein
MNKLLESVVEAHGGLGRWNQFNTVSAQIVSGGGLWALKGLIQDPAPRKMIASLHEELASVAPFGQRNFEVSEIEPIEEGTEQWRGLRVKFPKHIASHCDVQEFYFGDDSLLRRHRLLRRSNADMT